MPNLSKAVEKIKGRVRSGFPNGVDEESARDLKVLLNRIQELETALAPFAKISRTNPGNLELVHCYFRDCVRAQQAYTLDESPDIPTEIFFPAN